MTHSISPDFGISGPGTPKNVIQGSFIEDNISIEDLHQIIMRDYKYRVALNANCDGMEISFDPEKVTPPGTSVMTIKVNSSCSTGKKDIKIIGLSSNDEKEHAYNYTLNVITSPETNKVAPPEKYMTSIVSVDQICEIIDDKRKLNTSDQGKLLIQIKNAIKKGGPIISGNAYDFTIVGYSSLPETNELSLVYSSIDQNTTPPAIMLYDSYGLYWTNYTEFFTMLSKNYPSYELFEVTEWTPPDALFYPLNLCIVLDRSGSMDDPMADKTKMLGAKKATMGVIAALLPQDKISIVSFSGSANIDMDFTCLSDIKKDFGPIEAKINQIETEWNGTSFGAGLDSALKQFNNIETSDNSYSAILFLSDGCDNRRPYSGDYLSEYKRKEIPIFTIGFASDESKVGVANLTMMSYETGGTYFFVDDIFDLENAFLDKQHDASRWGKKYTYWGEVERNETLTLESFYVPAYVASLRLTLNWPGSDLDLVLLDPSGKQVNFSSPNVYYEENQNPESVIIYGPQQGKWTVKIYAKEIDDKSEPFYMRASIYEPPEISAESWYKNLVRSGHDEAYSVQQTIDNGYIIVGSTELWSNGGKDVWLAKTDSNGNLLWNKSFGGSGNDEGRSIQQTRDGGYIIAGSTESYGNGNKDVWLIKTDLAGKKEWSKTFGAAYYDGGHSVQETKDGGYIIVGRTSPNVNNERQDIWLIKTDSKGNEEWNKTTEGQFVDDSSVFVWQTKDDGYVVTGRTDSSHITNFDVLLMKWNSEGNEMWSRIIGGPGDEGGRSVHETADGGYIITGWTTSHGSDDKDVLLIKTNSTGYEIWNKTYGHGSPNDESGESIQQTKDGGYIVAGWTTSYGSGGQDKDVWLIKTDSYGKEEWSNYFGESGVDEGRSVQQTKDGGYIIGGFTNSYEALDGDIFLIKTNSNGEIEKKRR